MEMKIGVQAVFYVIVSVVGLTGNAVMLIVTIKSKKLHSICNYLIFSLCFADFLHLLCQIPNSISLFAEQQFTQSSCFFVQMIPLIGPISSSLIAFSLGIDRLLAVSFPIFYRNIQFHKTRCLLAYLSLPFAYTVWILSTAYSTRSNELISICNVPQALNTVAFEMLTTATLFINVTICILYCFTWRIISTKTLAKSFRSIFKSIAITVMLIIFGWIATMLINVFSFVFMKEHPDVLFVQMYAGFFVNCAAASNVFVYYFINAEYRREIRKILPLNEEPSEEINEATRLKRSVEI